MATASRPPAYSRKLRRLMRRSKRDARARISSRGIPWFSSGWSRHRLRRSAGLGSFAMASSLMKSTGQDVLDPVNFGGDISRGNARDFADRSGVEAFQVRKDYLAVERF